MHGAITARIQYDHDDKDGGGGGHDDRGDDGGHGDVCWLLLWGW